MRTKLPIMISVALLLVIAYPGAVEAIRGGGGGRGGGGRGGGGRSFSGGGGAARAAPRATSAPRPSYSRPTQASSFNRSAQVSRPQVSQGYRSSGGFVPSSGSAARRPAGGTGYAASGGGARFNSSTPSFASARPAARPAGGVAQRPGGVGGGAAGIAAGNRPAGNRPVSSQLGDFLGMTKPIERPGGGGLAGGPARPGAGGEAGRPGISGRPIGPERPGVGERPGGVNRPGGGLAAGPGRPGAGGQPERPGISGRPINPERPGVGERPGGINRPGGGVANRPGLENREGRVGAIAGNNVNRPVNIGNRTNNVINVQPKWANISAGQIKGINNRWDTAINRPNGRWNRPAGSYWNHWGAGVRTHWGSYARGYAHGWFNRGWWDNHHFGMSGWHYWHNFNRYPYSYWWTVPAWSAVTSWFAWPATSVVTQPVYYDYGPGGNVTYQDNSVYINGQQVASAADFAESAAALATVAPPTNEQEAESAEWMPLGTFAVSTSEQDTEPDRMLQLAVDKQGVIAGTLYNTQTDRAQAVQGKVDKDTQRVAFRIGESEDIVAETGLYNLTQDVAPVLVHFSKDRVDNYLLVRMEAPEQEGATAPGQ